MIFFGADKAKVVNDALGRAAREDRARAAATPIRGWQPLWVVDFPMFEYDEEEKRWDAMHHPFTAPEDGHEDAACSPTRRRASPRRYDMVLNGWEIGGGSVRIHRAEVQAKVFDALGIGPDEAQREVRLPAGSAAVRRAAARAASRSGWTASSP